MGTGKKSSLAIWSFVLALLGFVLLLPAVPGLILGVYALSEIKKANGQLAGKGLAIAGTAISGVLIVVLFIGLLAAVLLPTGTPHTTPMRRMEARKTAVELRTALMNYRSEYKHFPVLDRVEGVEFVNDGHADGDTLLRTNGASGLISALIAEPDNPVAKKLNRREIQFFSAPSARRKPEARKNSGGLWKDGDQYELFDPWGNYYHIMFDSNGNGVIKPPSTKDGITLEELKADVVVWSNGPDNQPGKGSGSKKNDDVYTY